MTSAAKYAQEDAGESERPLRVCAEAGRKCVRNIQQYPILSSEWLNLVDSLKQLSRLVQLEGRMPDNTKVGESLGRCGDGTLWDQEAHENAIRILVEEAKVNLCLRMMRDYKAWQYDPDLRHRTLHEATQAYELSELALEQKCRMFEESLGLLLAKAFQHVETLQLMDIPLLIEHLCDVLTKAIQARSVDTPAAPGQVQETLIIFYFCSLMKHAEQLNNGELLAKAREMNLLHLVTQHLLNNTSECQGDVVLAAAEGLSALADNEDFRTSWQEFFADDRAKIDYFMRLEDSILNEVLKTNPDKKKDLYPLIDFFNTVRRTYR